MAQAQYVHAALLPRSHAHSLARVAHAARFSERRAPMNVIQLAAQYYAETIDIIADPQAYRAYKLGGPVGMIARLIGPNGEHGGPGSLYANFMCDILVVAIAHEDVLANIPPGELVTANIATIVWNYLDAQKLAGNPLYVGFRRTRDGVKYIVPVVIAMKEMRAVLERDTVQAQLNNVIANLGNANANIAQQQAQLQQLTQQLQQANTQIANFQQQLAAQQAQLVGFQQGQAALAHMFGQAQAFLQIPNAMQQLGGGGQVGFQLPAPPAANQLPAPANQLPAPPHGQGQ